MTVTTTTRAPSQAGGPGASSAQDSSDSVAQTVRTFLPETWLWDLIKIEWVHSGCLLTITVENWHHLEFFAFFNLNFLFSPPTFYFVECCVMWCYLSSHWKSKCSELVFHPSHTLVLFPFQRAFTAIQIVTAVRFFWGLQPRIAAYPILSNFCILTNPVLLTFSNLPLNYLDYNFMCVN